MTQEELAKYEPRSGRAVYRAKYTLIWGRRRRPGTTFEYDYPMKADPDSYELVEVTEKPKLKGKAKAARKPAAKPKATKEAGDGNAPAPRASGEAKTAE